MTQPINFSFLFFAIKNPLNIFTENALLIAATLSVASAFMNTALAVQVPAEKSPAVDLSDMVLIPEGDFVMGDDLVEKTNQAGEFGNIKPWYLDEHPKHTVKLPAYFMEEHEVTNGQYLAYVAATGATPPDNWLTNGYVLSLKKDKFDKLDVERLRKLAANIFKIDKDTRRMGKQELLKDITEALASMDNLPVTYVDWSQANAYCQWAGLRLPSEMEWEKAARGASGQEFPWGNEWKLHMSNTGSEQWDTGVAPVESYQTDKSPYGIYDLAGNVSEWVADWYQAYPGSDYKSEAFGEKFKVARGGGWSGGTGHYALKLFQRGAYRSNLPPDQKFDDVGFRCAADDSPTIHAAVSHNKQHK